MFKRILSMLLVAALVVGVSSAVANAGVKGGFMFIITVMPQTTTGETSEFNFDFEAELDLNVTISGLTLSNVLTYGIGGVEHYIGDFAANLGALTLKDEFVFATPYYGVTTSYWGVWYFFDWIHPKRGHVGGTRGGPLLFVKKRVTSVISIGGLELYNLFMLEDVNFPRPTTTSLVPEDLDGDGDYDTADQQFAIGDILRIRGETPSGIRVTAWTGFCADWILFTYYPKHQLLKIFEWDYNLIKKKRFSETVEQDCYSFGDIDFDNDFDGLVDEDAIDGVDNDGDGLIDEDPVDHKPMLGFTKEVISVSRIPLPSGIKMDIIGVFSTVPYKLNYIPGLLGYPWNCPADGTWCYIPTRLANIPFFFDVVLQVPIAGMADLLIELWTDNVDGIDLDKLVVTFQLPEHGWFVHWYDNNGDLTLTLDDDIVLKGGVKLQKAVDLNFFAWLKPTVGFVLTELDIVIPISYPQPIGFLELLFNWCDEVNNPLGCDPGTIGTPRELDFQYWSIKLYKEFGPHNTFEVRARFNKYGFDEAGIIVGVSFAI